jgi:diadenosine tetraphosphate (Ap4A) HIT family hydrolase
MPHNVGVERFGTQTHFTRSGLPVPDGGTQLTERNSTPETVQMTGFDYARLEVHRLGSWIWQVHENQSYLGRMILRLARPEMRSLSHCTMDEWLSLHENIRAYESVLQELFSPDRFNYSQMGNAYPQLHVQAVPRYASHGTWRGRIFQDKNWGSNWAPTPRSPLTLQETYEFASWFQAEIRTRVAKQ